MLSSARAKRVAVIGLLYVTAMFLNVLFVLKAGGWGWCSLNAAFYIFTVVGGYDPSLLVACSAYALLNLFALVPLFAGDRRFVLTWAGLFLATLIPLPFKWPAP